MVAEGIDQIGVFFQKLTVVRAKGMVDFRIANMPV